MTPLCKQKYKKYNLTTPGWYRIGKFNYNLCSCGLLSFNVVAYSNNNSGILQLACAKGYNTITFEKLIYRRINATPIISKFRVVVRDYFECYIEAYKSTDEEMTLCANLAAEIEMELYDNAEAGNIPDGYSATELEL